MNEATTGQATIERELTFGEKAVGLKFNPAGDNKVDKIKRLYAEIIDICGEDIGERVYPEFEGKLLDEAVMKAITAQMAAVKLVTWKY